MKNSELKEYVNSFPDDALVSIIYANLRKRKLYKLENVMWVTDQGQPLILIDIGKEADMDAEMIASPSVVVHPLELSWQQATV